MSAETTLDEAPDATSGTPLLRRAVPDDAPALADLIGQLAAHHGDRATTDAAALRADLFGPSPWAVALVAEDGTRLVGYALLVRLYRAQEAARIVDLHPLFVAPGARCAGIGRRLIRAAEAEARAQGCVRLVVGTHADNHRAQSYDRMLGFADRPPGGPGFVRSLAPDRTGGDAR